MNLEELLQEANSKHASDVHITIGVPPKARIHGRLENLGEERLDLEAVKAFIEPLLDDEKKAKLDKKGEVDFSWSVPAVGRFRVNVFRQRGVYAMAIRLFPNEIPSPEKIGIPDSFMELSSRKSGLVLISGPAGSGKSTTVATLIDKINHTEYGHVITIEDPIEYLFRHDKCMVHQREVGIDTNSYREALEAAMRENADVIFVGELNDLETIGLALAAAETGHLVISLLNAVGVANTLDRIIEAFEPHQQDQVRLQLSNVIAAVVSQQLIPAIDGKGRVAAYEILYDSKETISAIKEGKISQLSEIIHANRKVGMQTMDDGIYDLFLKKQISRETLQQYSSSTAFII